MNNIDHALEKVKQYKIPFQETFGTALLRFTDPLFASSMGIYSFNIVMFDELMHSRGYSEDKDGSLNDYITKNYGQEASELIKKLINIIE